MLCLLLNQQQIKVQGRLYVPATEEKRHYEDCRVEQGMATHT